ncbi:MAG: ThuA domain-containing protein [Verrucomicrobia bacterium]|nr:ThuA domain-containing protein [Verrucomicrobiota bacterium]
MNRNLVVACLMVTTAALCLCGCSTVSTQRAEEKRVLVFTRNGPTLTGKKGFVHDNIASSVEAIQKLGAENGFAVDVSDDPKAFTDENLKKYKALVFSNTNNEVFDTEEQKKALQNYVHAGGGIVGIHSACAMMRDWPWMWQLMGGTFNFHPKFQPFTIKVVDRKHPSTAHLGETWEWEDEFYFLKEMPKGLHILLEGDLTKLEDKRKPADEKSRPLAWCHEFEGGRCWFTALGHKKEQYSDSNLMKHILGGIQWAMGEKK